MDGIHSNTAVQFELPRMPPQYLACFFEDAHNSHTGIMSSTGLLDKRLHHARGAARVTVFGKVASNQRRCVPTGAWQFFGMSKSEHKGIVRRNILAG